MPVAWCLWGWSPCARDRRSAPHHRRRGAPLDLIARLVTDSGASSSMRFTVARYPVSLRSQSTCRHRRHHRRGRDREALAGLARLEGHGSRLKLVRRRRAVQARSVDGNHHPVLRSRAQHHRHRGGITALGCLVARAVEGDGRPRIGAVPLRPRPRVPGSCWCDPTRRGRSAMSCPGWRHLGGMYRDLSPSQLFRSNSQPTDGTHGDVRIAIAVGVVPSMRTEPSMKTRTHQGLSASWRLLGQPQAVGDGLSRFQTQRARAHLHRPRNFTYRKLGVPPRGRVLGVRRGRRDAGQDRRQHAAEDRRALPPPPPTGRSSVDRSARPAAEARSPRDPFALIRVRGSVDIHGAVPPSLAAPGLVRGRMAGQSRCFVHRAVPRVSRDRRPGGRR